MPVADVCPLTDLPRLTDGSLNSFRSMTGGSFLKKYLMGRRRQYAQSPLSPSPLHVRSITLPRYFRSRLLISMLSSNASSSRTASAGTSTHFIEVQLRSTAESFSSARMLLHKKLQYDNSSNSILDSKFQAGVCHSSRNYCTTFSRSHCRRKRCRKHIHHNSEQRKSAIFQPPFELFY